MKRRSDLSLKTCSPKDETHISKGIRTRLSTGTLIMSGTSTLPSDPHLQERPDSPSNSSSAGSDINISHHLGGKDSVSPSRKRKAADNKECGEFSNIPPKRKKIGRNDGSGEGNRNDYFCWICHKEGVVICCELCPRVFHAKCLNIENNVPQDWVCPECEKIMKAECTDTRSKTMTMISVGTLCTLLRYALDRMRTVGSETFEHLVDLASFPNYSDYVFHPMSLAVLERNIKRKNYGCTEAFLADAKWIYHNSYVYNGAQNKITVVARSLLKVCKHEMSEIEVCPDCYYNSCLQIDSDWFCEPCRTPHPLVWAKLKGYPFWPAKALREVNDQVDVRFFGAHDRSWVPVASCFMLSKACPVIVKKGRGGMQEAMREVDVHIKKLREILGSFEYAPFRTPYSRDSVYSKLKSSDTGKASGHGKLSAKTKSSDGRIGDKYSMVSKTAMALKSKYIGINSKKGAQQPGTVMKMGSAQTQQRQIIYLKPMPKGVFLLTEQQVIEPITGKSSIHGTTSRSNIPDLQLDTSSKVLPTTQPPTSTTIESSHGKGQAKEVLPKEKAIGEEAQLENLVKVGGNGTNYGGEITVEKMGDEIEHLNNGSMSCTQNVLLSKNLASDRHESSINLANTELETFSSEMVALSREKNNVESSSNQDLGSVQNSQQKSIETGNEIAEDIPCPDLTQSLQTSNNTVSDSSVNVRKISDPTSSPTSDNQIDSGNTSSDTYQEVSNVTSISFPDLSVAISNCADHRVPEIQNKEFTHFHKDTTISGVADVPSSVSLTNQNVLFTSCRQTLKNNSDRDARTVSPSTVDNTLEKSYSINNETVSNTITCDTILQPSKEDQCEEKTKSVGESESIQNVTVGSTTSCVSSSLEVSVLDTGLMPVTTGIGSPTSCASSSLTVSAADTGLISVTTGIGSPTSCASSSLTVSAADTGLISVITDIGSPTSCAASSLVVSAAETGLTATVVTTGSPGSKYKESLQKVIDSCKAKLGIDDETLPNVENDDPFILECDFDEEDGIIISDNDIDDDGDVLLMDIDEDNEELVESTPTNSVSISTKSTFTEEISSISDEIVRKNPTQQNFEQLHNSLHSETHHKGKHTDLKKDSHSKLELKNQNESNKIGDKKCNNVNSANFSLNTDVASKIAVRSSRERDTDDGYNPGTSRSTNNRTASSLSQNNSSNCDSTLNASRNITMDSILVERSQTSLSVTQTEDSSATTSEHTQIYKGSSGKAWEEQEPNAEETRASKGDDETSIISIVDDDDDDCSILDAEMTLDMEVVCADVPDGQNDEDVVSDNETSGVVVSQSNNSNKKGDIRTPMKVLDNSPVQNGDKTPAAAVVVNSKQPQNIPQTSVSYPTLRETLGVTSATGNASSGNITLQTSKISQTSTVSTLLNSHSNNFSMSSTESSASQKIIPSSSTENHVLVLPQEKTRPRILSKNKRKTPTTLITPENAMVISLDDCGDNFEDDDEDDDISKIPGRVSSDGIISPEVNTIIDSDDETELATAADETHQTHLEGTECEDQSAILKAKLASVVTRKYSLFNKFIMEHLNDLVDDVKKVTEQSVPQCVEYNKQQKVLEKRERALEKQQGEYKKKIKDISKTWKATLKESLASFKLQKATLAERLKEEFSKELQKAIADTKKQQWCAECWTEAVYYCCWNTSYCSYQCQQKHWPTHMSKCMQTQQTQGATSQTVSRSPKIISTLNAVNGTSKGTNSSLTASNIIGTTASSASSQSTTAITPLAVSKTVQIIPSVSIVSPSQWKVNEEVSKTKKMFSLITPQSGANTTTPISTLSIGPQHFQIQYLQQQGSTGTLPQQVQVMGNNPSIPILMPSMITQAQNQAASPAQLLHNTSSMFPLIQRPQQSGISQKSMQHPQQIGSTRYIIPGTFGAFMRPGGPV